MNAEQPVVVTKKKKRSFIRSAHLGVVVSHSLTGEDAATVYSGFCQCNLLSEFVSGRPDSFVVEKWESEDSQTWTKVGETTYEGVEWKGCVHHNSPDEMSACMGRIDISYKNMVENTDFQEVTVTFDRWVYAWDFIASTEQKV